MLALFQIFPDVRKGHPIRLPEGRYLSGMHVKKGVQDLDGVVGLDEVDMELPPYGGFKIKD